MPQKNPDEQEIFSNPLAPDVELEDEMEDDGQGLPLTNDDFRKLMMTPHLPRTSSHAHSTKTTKEEQKMGSQPAVEDEEEDAASRRRKKKMFYAKQHKLEEEREKELAKMYRNRAQERREGLLKDDGTQEQKPAEVASTTADYRAVAPDAASGENLAERRKQLIQESKYLGGDMEHTHLVKGLDYALLEKVRAEICNKEQEEDLMEAAVSKKTKELPEEKEPQLSFHSKMARNIFRTLFRQPLPTRNELFMPGRMAYAVDLEDDTDETDIPTTLIRSKSDCPNEEVTTTMTTNDLVINKLTQILSYLRQGRKENKKLKKKDRGKLREMDERPKLVEDSIYGDIGNYAPSPDKSTKSRDNPDKSRDSHELSSSKRDRGRDRAHHDRSSGGGGGGGKSRAKEEERSRGSSEKKRSYFEKPSEEDDSKLKLPSTTKEMVDSINERFTAKAWESGDGDKEKKLTREEEQMKKLKTKMKIDSYAECYPGMMESADAIDDSDEEVDYMKMDQGNKKGPVGRWDFDSQEEYSSYMSNKEALPKAAFQYGVKMTDGRKTRRTGPKKDEKHMLDREWQQIQKLISKRKHPGIQGSSKKTAKY